MNYSVSIESLQRNFPEDFDVPTLLLDFGDWLKTKSNGSVGYFCLASERFNDFWIENGADLHPYFAFFLCDPTGGQIGYWLYDGRATVMPPIAWVGSEGELNVVSDSLEGLLIRLEERNTGVPDLDSRVDDADESPGLFEWIHGRAVSEPPLHSRGYPNLKRWMDQWGQQQRDLIDQDEVHLQIARELRSFVKPNAQSWETANFDVLLVGTQFKMWHRSFGAIPMPQDEIAGLEPLFRTAREQRAQKFPERGLWFSAWVKVGSRGGANLCCNFMDEPRILDDKPIIPTSDYEHDFIAYPRSPHWTPEWF